MEEKLIFGVYGKLIGNSNYKHPEYPKENTSEQSFIRTILKENRHFFITLFFIVMVCLTQFWESLNVIPEDEIPQDTISAEEFNRRT